MGAIIEMQVDVAERKGDPLQAVSLATPGAPDVRELMKSLAGFVVEGDNCISLGSFRDTTLTPLERRLEHIETRLAALPTQPTDLAHPIGKKRKRLT